MIQHIGLQYPDKENADLFFGTILGLPKQKEFTVPADVSRMLFGKDKDIEVVAYGDDTFKFELFITPGQKPQNFDHIGWTVKNKDEFIEVCKKNNIDHIIMETDGKVLTFVRDRGGNMYEIKEM
jgi:hypothetical protein